MEILNKIFTPPENGLRELKLKIAAKDKATRKEFWFLQAATLALAAITFFVWLRPPVDPSWSRLFEKPQDTARLELPNPPAGIHLYWITR